MSVQVLGCPKTRKAATLVYGRKRRLNLLLLGLYYRRLLMLLENSPACWYAGSNCYKVYVEAPGKIPLGYLHQTITGEIKVKTKIQLPDVKVCSHTTENGQKNSLTIEKLADSCKELTSQIKSVPDVVVKTERLKTSTDMFQNHKMTLPNGVLLNDSIVCLHEDTSLRSKLLLQLQ
uniref:Uncharacterized protein n=1 Tax=Magallana gigas TaxID=29159 RepID=K1QY31_MAGGI